MPIYEFECRNCDSRFTTLVVHSEAVGCPYCGSCDVGKLMSVPGRPVVPAWS